MSRAPIVRLHDRAPALKVDLNEREQAARILDAARNLYAKDDLSREAWRAVHFGNPRQSALDALQQQVESVASELAALPGRLLEAADVMDIAAAVDKFIGRFPQRPHDHEAYAEGLCEEIASVRPSRLALSAGLHELLRTTRDFLPFPSKVHDAISEAEKSFANLPRQLKFRLDQLQAARRNQIPGE